MCRVGTGIFVFELLQRKAVTKWCKLAKERLAGPELGGIFDLAGMQPAH